MRYLLHHRISPNSWLDAAGLSRGGTRDRDGSNGIGTESTEGRTVVGEGDRGPTKDGRRLLGEAGQLRKGEGVDDRRGAGGRGRAWVGVNRADILAVKFDHSILLQN